MGVLQSIPLCSREKAKSCEVPPLEMDSNNNDPNTVVNSQPCATVGSSEGPDATSTPRRRLGSLDDDEFGSTDLEIPTGLENPNARVFNEAVVEEVDEDDIGPVVDQVVGGSDEEGDSGLESTAERHLDAFRKRHNMDAMRREAMTPPPLPGDEGSFDYQFEDVNYEDDDDDETINVEDEDSRELSSSDDPLERPPEPTIPDEVPKRLSSSGSDSPTPSSPEDNGNEPYFEKMDATTNHISNILSEIVGDKPHGDYHTSVANLR